MNQTRSLCFAEPNIVEFDAVIIKVIHDKNSFKVLLNKTYFFPKGGGQPADRGWLNGVVVTDVYENEAGVLHVVEGRLQPGPVHGKIDEKNRLDYMQQHTGQHIISAALWKIGRRQTVSVHMGGSHTTIDIDSDKISYRELCEVEQHANRIIRDNLQVNSFEVDIDRVHAYPLRKPNQKKDNIRLVRIRGIDWIGCCGMHLARTGLVGLIKCTGVEKIRNDTRLIWKIGDRAYRDYAAKIELFNELRTVLGTCEERMYANVSRLVQDNAELTRQNHAQVIRLGTVVADSLVGVAQKTQDSHMQYIRHGLENESADFFLALGKELIARVGVVFYVTNRSESAWHWMVGCSESLEVDLSDLMQEVLASNQAVRGGGRHPLWRGIALSRTDLDRMDYALQTFLSDEK